MRFPLSSAPLRWRVGALALAICWGLAATANAVILFGTGDPDANTEAPTGALADSGWQFEGTWGGFLGTPIALHFFLSAAHIGQAGGATFEYAGSTYHIVRAFADPNSDLLLWQVQEAFPVWAPLYTKHDETGHPLMVIGRGTLRGEEIFLGGDLKGWAWGDSGRQRWGLNVVAAVVRLGPGNDALYATFDQGVGSNEAMLSAGDSGGAVFLNDKGVWKLAGINYAVDGPFYTDASGGGAFFAALFDARGFYYHNNSAYVLLEDSEPIPTGFYSTRVSSKLGWIYSVIDPTGDPDGDGIPNLIEYALQLDPLTPDAAGLPQLAMEGNALTLTYPKAALATDLTFAVEQSADLVSWTEAQSQNQTISTVNGTQTIKASVPFDASAPSFLRLKVTRAP